MRITSSIDLSPKEVKLTGTCVDFSEIFIHPLELKFTDVIQGQEDTKSISFENTGIKFLEISKLSITGADAGKFNIKSGGATPINIQPGTTHTIDIEFTPALAATYSAYLNIEHDGRNDESPIEYKLTGTGIDLKPKLGIDQSSPWDFGTVGAYLKYWEKAKIENYGTDPLLIRDITVLNGIAFNIAEITFEGNVVSTPITLNPTEEIEVVVEFVPPADIQYQDKLIIDHNGINTSRPLEIDLNGNGKVVATQTFQFTGASQQFTVPNGVQVVYFELWGGSGGDTHPNFPNTVPGKGGYVSGFMYVNPGDTFELNVGGKGADGIFGSGGLGGWNGGGFGGTFTGTQQYGGGGGGATDIRFVGNTLYHRVIVAGAGGGASAHMALCHGGDGGGLEAGHGKVNDIYQTGYCGDGGTQDHGGGGAYHIRVVSHGFFGIGGNAKDSHNIDEVSGGDRGAGWWGGGAGLDGGGGGGSSYTDPQYIFSPAHQQGTHVGNGKIKITY